MWSLLAYFLSMQPMTLSKMKKASTLLFILEICEANNLLLCVSRGQLWKFLFLSWFSPERKLEGRKVGEREMSAWGQECEGLWDHQVENYRGSEEFRVTPMYSLIFCPSSP